MVKIKSKKNINIHWAKNNQRTKTSVIILFFILIALFFPILMGRFPTKAVGSGLPGIWYDNRTGSYMTDVMAAGYWGIPNDPATPLNEFLFNRAFNYAGNTDYIPPTDYIGCSGVATNLGYARTVCDVGGDFGASEPVSLDGFGFNGTENADIITIVGFQGLPAYNLQTVLVSSSNTDALISFLGINYPLFPVLSVLRSVFIANGAGEDYTINPTTDPQDMLDPAWPNNVFFDIDTTAIDNISRFINFWGGDGLGGATRDDTAPSAINISAVTTGSGSGKVDLAWTATGDNAAVGTAYSYIMKYSLSSINNGNFDLATSYTQTWTPQATGATENLTVDGLSPGGTYYFSVKACDEYKTCGAYGNTISAVASLIPPAYVPPVTDITLEPSLLINDGVSSITDNKLVKLTINNSGEYISKMRISNFSDFRDSPTDPMDDFVSEISSWDLCKGITACSNGAKTVYIDLYNSGNVSSGSFSSSITLARPTTVLINDGASITNNKNVTLSISNFNDNASFLKISNLADLSDTDFQTYSSTVNNWDLCKGFSPCANGDKKVYVQLYNSDKQSISGIILSSINLNIPIEEEKKEEVVLPITENVPITPQIPVTPGLNPTEPEPNPTEPEPVLPEPEPIPIEPIQLKTTIQKIDEIATSVGTPIVSVVLAATAALTLIAVVNSFVDFVAILRHLIVLLLQFLGIKRKNKNWGVIYDSATKEPLQLCIVRLFDAKTNILSQTAVTDAKGRFGLFPVMGKYYMTVTKPLFSFPSRSLRGITYDIGYSSLYFGEKKFLSGKSIINFAVPLDKFSLRKKSRRTLIAIRSFLISLSTPLAILGALLSLTISIINPTILNYIVFTVYLVILFFKKLFISPPKKPSVQVVDYKNQKPIAKIAVEIFSKKYKKLIATKVSDKKGRFNLFLPDGEYFLKSSDNRYNFVSNKKLENSYNGGTLIVGSDKPFSGINIYLKKRGK